MNKIDDDIMTRFYRSLDTESSQVTAEYFSENCAWHRKGEVLSSRQEVITALNQRSAERVTRHLVSGVVRDPDHPSTLHFSLSVYDNASAPKPNLVAIMDGHAMIELQDEQSLIRTLKCTKAL